MAGYILLYRSLLDNWVWADNRIYSKAEAWVDILMLVNFAEGTHQIGDELLPVHPGSRYVTIRELCKRWKWSNTKVVKFLGLLEDDKMIVQNHDKKKTLLTVVNWHLYQSPNDKKTSEKRQENDKETTLNKEGNTGKEEKEYILFPDDDQPPIDSKPEKIESFFKECWNLYPLKRGQVSKTQKEKLFKLGDELKRCISRYLKFVDGERKRGFELQYKNGSTFFNNGYKDYLDEVYAAKEPDLPDYSNLPIKYVNQESSPVPEKEAGDVDF